MHIFLFLGVHDTADGGLRDLLLRIAAFGLYVYSLFGVIAGALKLDSMQNLAVLVTSTLTIIQVNIFALIIKITYDFKGVRVIIELIS